jgi:hypothetical protein
LLCLVFFTQSAFAWFGNDCRQKRRAYKQERNTCYQNNDRCQKQLRNESALVKELKTQKNEAVAQRNTCQWDKEGWKTTAWVFILCSGLLAIAGSMCLCRINNQNAQIAAQNAQLAAHQPIHNVGGTRCC